jgi:type I restriction enzyme S subunit
MKLPPYPRTKPSGVEWLGDVPEHWEVKRLKTSATCWVSNVDKVPAEDELPVRLCNYTDVYYHDHITSDMELMETTATADEIRRFGLRVGDVVITKDSEEWSDIAVPALVKKTAPDLVCGYHLAIIRSHPKALLGDYLLRAFESCAVNQQFQVAASGVTRYGLPKASIGDAWIPLPDLSEQRAIAALLDRETGRLDRLVAKKRELIERLKEKRTALITRTVTRGLPSAAARALSACNAQAGAGLPENPPLKPSGLDWLGDIPAHWEVKRLKFVCPHITVGIVVEPSKYYVDEGVACLRSLNVKAHRLVENDLVFISAESNDLHSKSKIYEGDLVAVRSGQPGTTAIVDRRFHGANCIDLIIIRKPHGTTSSFLDYFLNSELAMAQFETGTGGAIQQHFNITTAASLQIIVPPLPEQAAIAAYLDLETAKLDALVGKVELAVERLQEYRTALITAAVTGKIDVRQAALDGGGGLK